MLFRSDKAIDIIDEAASRVRIKHRALPPALKEEKQAEDSLRKEKEAALASREYDAAADHLQNNDQQRDAAKTEEE